MPRVYLNDNDRLSARLAKWVYGELKTRKMSQNTLANEMGISQQALSQKLSKQQFSFSDFLTFVSVFEPSSDELGWLVKGE